MFSRMAAGFSHGKSPSTAGQLADVGWIVS